MTAAPRPRVVFVDGVPMSGLVAEADADPRAGIVALHGGASTAAYFDCTGHPRLSLLRAGATLGFTVVALAYAAVDKILGSRPRGAGLFLFAHSNGCELALRMAADERGAALLGLELAGTGLQYHDAALDILRSATATHRPPGLRTLLWQPAELYPADVLTGITNSSTGAPYEATMVKDWPRQDFPVLAAQVRVPVQFSHADHERVWRSDPEAMAEIAAKFTASPRFVTNEQVNTGHNLSLGTGAAAYHLKVMSFVEECVVARTRASVVAHPEVEVEAG